MEQKELEIYDKAIITFHFNAQRLMLFEEIGELMNAIAKLPRGRATIDNVIEELADVAIMVNQMAVFFGWEKFLAQKEMKLIRLKERLEKYQEE